MKKSPKKYKVENTYRSDIKFNTTNYKKANVIRALQYENIDYEIRDNNIIYVIQKIRRQIYKHFTIMGNRK